MLVIRSVIDCADSLDEEVSDRELQVSVQGTGRLEPADQSGSDVDVPSKRREEVDNVGAEPCNRAVGIKVLGCIANASWEFLALQPLRSSG